MNKLNNDEVKDVNGGGLVIRNVGEDDYPKMPSHGAVVTKPQELVSYYVEVKNSKKWFEGMYIGTKSQFGMKDYIFKNVVYGDGKKVAEEPEAAEHIIIYSEV